MSASTLNANPGPGYRALVVDGDDAARRSLESELAALGRIAAVDSAGDGEAALAKAAAAQYDLIFLGGPDGYETCSRLRRMPAYRRTPIVMVSGRATPPDGARGVKAGCTAYLAKPVRPDALRHLGRRVLA